MDVLPFDVLYDNGPVLVVNKPAGLLTQAPAGIDSLEVWIKAFYRQREGKAVDVESWIEREPRAVDRIEFRAGKRKLGSPWSGSRSIMGAPPAWRCRGLLALETALTQQNRVLE